MTHDGASILPQGVLDAVHPGSRVVVLTGAGISAASGVPTFRGEGGLWRNHRAEELATPAAFERDPGTVWEWYAWRRDLVRRATPNPAHRALVELAQLVEDLVIITQNVDGLHARAGSTGVLEMHGSLWRQRCTECGREREHPGPGPDAGNLPRCPCGGLERPAVVWFGENLDPRVMDRCVDTLRACDILLVVGTSGIVQPAASLAALAKRFGAVTVDFNLECPRGGDLDVSVVGPCEETLVALVAAVRERHTA